MVVEYEVRISEMELLEVAARRMAVAVTDTPFNQVDEETLEAWLLEAPDRRIGVLTDARDDLTRLIELLSAYDRQRDHADSDVAPVRALPDPDNEDYSGA